MTCGPKLVPEISAIDPRYDLLGKGDPARCRLAARLCPWYHGARPQYDRDGMGRFGLRVVADALEFRKPQRVEEHGRSVVLQLHDDGA